jgi:hypothetical protein
MNCVSGTSARTLRVARVSQDGSYLNCFPSPVEKRVLRQAAALDLQHAHQYFPLLGGPLPEETLVVLLDAGGVIDDVGEH